VSWSKQNRKWQSQIKIDGKTKHIGVFDIEIKAAMAWDTVARAVRGNSCKLNFPDAQFTAASAPPSVATALVAASAAVAAGRSRRAAAKAQQPHLLKPSLPGPAWECQVAGDAQQQQQQQQQMASSEKRSRRGRAMSTSSEDDDEEPRGLGTVMKRSRRGGAASAASSISSSSCSPTSVAFGFGDSRDAAFFGTPHGLGISNLAPYDPSYDPFDFEVDLSAVRKNDPRVGNNRQLWVSTGVHAGVGSGTSLLFSAQCIELCTSPRKVAA